MAEPTYEAMSWPERLEWHLRQVTDNHYFDDYDEKQRRVARRLAWSYGDPNLQARRERER